MPYSSKPHFLTLGLAFSLLLAYPLTSTAGTAPDKLKEKMEKCQEMVNELESASKEFSTYIQTAKEDFVKPVSDQAELSDKDWNKLITKPRSKEWRGEKDKVKKAIADYEKNCKNITSGIEDMDKPAE